ncbi:MAG: hypothetical protein LBV32_03015 [Tannerellaceae bacterium]|jgi:hypothetical protein|nr:hypothetical protein [Tannerellaceae bacterium]
MNTFLHKIGKMAEEFSEKAMFSASVVSVLKSVSIYSTDEYYIYKWEILPIIRQNTTPRKSKNYRILKK